MQSKRNESRQISYTLLDRSFNAESWRMYSRPLQIIRMHLHWYEKLKNVYGLHDERVIKAVIDAFIGRIPIVARQLSIPSSCLLTPLGINCSYHDAYIYASSVFISRRHWSVIHCVGIFSRYSFCDNAAHARSRI